MIDSLIESYSLIWESFVNNPSDYSYIVVMIIMVPFFIFINLKKINTNVIMLLINLPGTILHEILHLFIGLILLAKPTSFSIIPKKTSEGWTLGSVGFKGVNEYNAMPISMAPILAPLVILLMIPDIFNYMNTIENYLFLKTSLVSFLLSSILVNCIPSSVDFKLMFEYKIGLILYTGIIYLIIDYIVLGKTSLIYGILNS